MGDSGILDKVQSHFTVVGHIWARVHFIFRILVLWAGVTIVWGDERSQMVCEPNTPGCEGLCYDWKFPISHVWFWVMQIILVSVPSLLYLGYVVEAIRRENKLKQEQKHPNPSKVVIEGNLVIIYLTQLLVKIVIEVAFIVGQNFLFGFSMIPKFLCNVPPCNLVTECFMFRSIEKTTFIIFMLVLSCVSLALTVGDVFYLLPKRGLLRILRRYNRSAPTWKETNV